MAEKGHWSIDSTGSQLLVAANYNRAKLVIQARILSYGIMALGFGVPAVAGQGMQIVAAGGTVAVAGELARLAVYGICGTGAATATGGYQEDLGVCS